MNAPVASPTRHASSVPISQPADAAPSAVAVRAGRILTAAVVILLAVSSLAGLLLDGLYEDPDSVASMLRGYDLAALVAAVPALAATLAPSLRSSIRARLVAAGLLAFVVYDYAYYVFGTTFNDLFLLHVATFSTATFALILTLSSLDVGGSAARFRARTPVRTVAVLLAVLAAGLAVLWISEALAFALSGTVPDEGNALVYPIAMTHLGYVMDLAFLVPAYALGAALLWRRRPWGYVLGVVLLVAGTFTQLTYIAALVFQFRAGIEGASAFDPFEPVILAAYLVSAGLLLANAPGDRYAEPEMVPLT